VTLSSFNELADVVTKDMELEVIDRELRQQVRKTLGWYI
jgi:hypothetical protein